VSMPEQQRARISARMKRRPWSAARRAAEDKRKAEGKKREPWSDEYRANHSVVMKAAWARRRERDRG
jgi:hypothetical protein